MRKIKNKDLTPQMVRHRIVVIVNIIAIMSLKKEA